MNDSPEMAAERERLDPDMAAERERLDPEMAAERERLDRHPALKRLISRLCGCEETEVVLQGVQPALVGLIDGTVSTLAPIFAAAVSSSSHTALLVGLATALGAGVSMGISEALSDTGEETGRGTAWIRGT